jgi:hypothetical protein
LRGAAAMTFDKIRIYSQRCGMMRSLRRTTAAVALSSLASFAILVGDAAAQTTPGFQSMAPSSTAPPQMPSILSTAPPVNTPDTSDAPLAQSTSSCQSDLQKISGKRLAAIDQLNKLAKANKGRLDPVAACPKFQALVKIEKEFRDYLVKNKDWCGIPDDVEDTVSQSATKDATVSVKACALAVEFKKAQAQAAAGLSAQAPKLPAGPL